MYLFIRRTGISFTQCNTECIYFECMFDHLVNICADGLIHHDIFLILALDCLQSLIKALDLYLPTLKEGSQGLINTCLDLVTQDFKIEKDLC